MTDPSFSSTDGAERLGALGIVGVLLLPLAIAGLLAWGLAAPVSDFDRVTAAIVNDDEPVQLNGQTVPLGREFAAGLIGGIAGEGAPDDPGADATATPAPSGPNFTWILTNDGDAATGLRDGRYAAVLTIPPSFSADATSISGPAADAVHATLHVQTTPSSAYLDPALTEVITQAAVATFNAQLTERYLGNVYQGFNTINEQIGQAADGAAELASGASSLASGANSLAAGTSQLATGLDSLDAGAAALAAGLAQLDASVQALPSDTAQLAAGSAQVAAALDAIAGALDGATADVARVVDDLCAARPGPACDRARSVLARVQAVDGDIDALASGADQVAAGNAQLAAGMPGLVAGVDASAAGANEVAAGAAESAAGGEQVNEGAQEVASGADETASGAAQLSDGLAQAVEQIPTYSDSDISTLSSVVAQPARTDIAVPASGTQSVPLFATFALWVGAIVLALARRAVPQRRLLTSSSTVSITGRSIWPGAALGAGQGLLVGLALQPALDADVAARVGFAAAAVFVGTVFALVNHGLAAGFGGPGRTAAAIAGVIGLAAGVSSTVPAVIAGTANLIPTGPGHSLLLAGLGVGSGWGDLVALVVYAAIGAALVVLGVARHRTAVG
ncbi:YhgE/Pip domain-containing protein [Agromyces sp. M3QZ16-3]|uniref:YhgE/Pip domain-containing protein n=1 Tax=Agromyces sp. M3QZ16-3 TaxID=3447585 RepID=UPI003F68E5A7